jgi:hypothetical protein
LGAVQAAVAPPPVPAHVHTQFSPDDDTPDAEPVLHRPKAGGFTARTPLAAPHAEWAGQMQPVSG